MRTTSIVLIGMLGAACGGPPPATPPSETPAAATPADAPRTLAMPADQDLYGAPRPDEGDLNELFDIARDLQGVAASREGAVRDLAEDLERFAASEDEKRRASGLADSVGRALSGRTLDETAAGRLAVALYVAMHADALSAAQQAGAAGALGQTLAAAGAAAPQVDAVVQQLPRATAR